METKQNYIILNTIQLNWIKLCRGKKKQKAKDLSGAKMRQIVAIGGKGELSQKNLNGCKKRQMDLNDYQAKGSF